jgi:hypothetical protein
MNALPSLQTWCVVPSSPAAKFTKAHEYLQKNPAILSEVLRRSRLRHSPPTFSVSISSANGIDAASVLDILQKWDLTDVLDLRLGDAILEIVFRSPISAHVCSRIPDFQATPLSPIPRTARVPLVYVQGIGGETKLEEIRGFFKSIAPIVKMKFVVRDTIGAHILKFSSVRKALRAAETADRERFKGNLLVVSHQYKGSVTRCFFLSGPSPGALTAQSVRAEVAKIGEIASIFVNAVGPMREVFVEMEDIRDARLACGVMNRRIYNGETVHAVFVDPAYFGDVREANSTTISAQGQLPAAD